MENEKHKEAMEQARHARQVTTQFFQQNLRE